MPKGLFIPLLILNPKINRNCSAEVRSDWRKRTGGITITKCLIVASAGRGDHGGRWGGLGGSCECLLEARSEEQVVRSVGIW